MQRKKTNTMRSPIEKESIVLEALENGISSVADKYALDRSVLKAWIKKYRSNGVDGLISQTGKKSKGHGRPKTPKTREEQLKLEILKLKIENERLKKGYLTKGVGVKKEYVTIKDLNMKS